MNRARHKCKHPARRHAQQPFYTNTTRCTLPTAVSNTHTQTHTQSSFVIFTWQPADELPALSSFLCHLRTPLLRISLELVSNKRRLWTNTSHLFALCHVSHRLHSLLPSSTFHFFVWVCVCVRGNSKLQDQVSAKGQEKKSEKDYGETWLDGQKCGKTCYINRDLRKNLFLQGAATCDTSSLSQAVKRTG